MVTVTLPPTPPMLERAFNAVWTVPAAALKPSEFVVWPLKVSVKVPADPLTLMSCISEGVRALLPALMAGLMDSRATVWVNPPLLAREASWGLSGEAMVPVRSEPTQPVLPSVLPIRLFPREVTD